ncbi:MAG: SMP-30/gluconolactonase/LRE family protein, partial [Myxococcota bacterium]
STPNAMCFSPDGGTAYVADSKTRHIMRQPLDADGWPDGERQPFFQLDRGNAVPDGAVVDSEGHRRSHGASCASGTGGAPAVATVEGFEPVHAPRAPAAITHVPNRIPRMFKPLLSLDLTFSPWTPGEN